MIPVHVMATEKLIKIAIVDDHQMFADGLVYLLASINKSYRCTTITSPLAAIRLVDGGQKFDLIISDLIMDSLNGIAFIKALRTRGIKAPILIVSGISTAPPVEEALRLGAQGFLPKSSSSEMLAEALDTILAGDIYLPPQLWSAYTDSERSPENKCDTGGTELSQRQLEVLQLVSQGFSNREIAGALNVSENTVKTHVKRLFKQLNVNTRAACVHMAQSMGYI
tara:strand:- start:22582 stop:23253 length:672 start_codon:yes stop_codon:yes gene_type:complete